MKKNKKKIIFVLLFFCILLGGCKEKMKIKTVEMSFLACGDADVTVIEDDTHYILIDTGEDTCRNTVLSYLESKNINKIDLMILTHPDKDHIGNATAIMKKWNVEKIIASSYKKGSTIETELLDYVKENYIDYQTPKDSIKMKIGQMNILIEPPKKEQDSSNNSSLATFITVGDITTFFGADMKKKRIEELLEQNILKSELVKLPYHGRYVSNMKELLNKLKPEFVVITASSIEEKTKTMLEKLKIPYELTTENIIFEIDGTSIKRKR